MKINIAIPDNPALLKYFRSIENLSGEDLNIFRMNEKKINEYFLNNRLDAAFLSPIGYGSGVGVADFRIIPGFCIAAEGYTSLATIFYKPGLKNVRTLASPSPDDYVIRVGGLMLSELYNIETEIEKSSGNPGEILKSCDAALLWQSAGENDTSQDITEEWTMANGFPLPIGFWICRNEEHPKNIEALVNSLSNLTIGLEERIVEEYTPGYVDETREGRIILNFTPEVEHALDETLQFLFYQLFFPEIPAVKVLGREE